jgi:hypothetical protein
MGFPVQGLVAGSYHIRGPANPLSGLDAEPAESCPVMPVGRFRGWATDSLDGFLVLFDALRDVWKVPEPASLIQASIGVPPTPGWLMMPMGTR